MLRLPGLRARNDAEPAIMRIYVYSLLRAAGYNSARPQVVALTIIKMSLDDVHKLLARVEFVSECIRLDYSADALYEAETIKKSLLQALERVACSYAPRPELLN